MEFQAKHVEKITGVKRNRLQAWLERGYIKPSIQVADGHGTRNKYNLYDLYTIAIFKKIVESGLVRELVARFITELIPLSQLKLEYLFLKNTQIALVREGKKITAYPVLGEDGQGYKISFGSKIESAIEDFDDMYILNYSKITRVIDAKVKEVMGEK